MHRYGLPIAAVALLFSAFALQAATVKPASSSTEIAYLLVGSTLHTYTIDRTTGNPTE